MRPNASQPGGVGGTRRSSTADGRWSFRRAAGCRAAISCSSPTAASRPWPFSTPCAAAASPPSLARHPVRRSTSPRRPAQAAPPPSLGAIGRPRKKGARLPTLRDVLAAQHACWKSVRVAGRSRRGRARHRDRLGHRRVAACRPARRADPSGADPRSRAPLRAPGAAWHRPGPRPSPDRRLGRRGAGASSSPSRRRARIWASRRSGSGPTRPSRARRRACSPCSPWWRSWRIAAPPASGDGPRRRGTPRLGPPLSRRPGRRAPGDLARAGLGDARVPRAPNETPPQPAGALGPRPPPRRLNGQSRAERGSRSGGRGGREGGADRGAAAAAPLDHLPRARAQPVPRQGAARARRHLGPGRPRDGNRPPPSAAQARSHARPPRGHRGPAPRRRVARADRDPAAPGRRRCVCLS